MKFKKFVRAEWQNLALKARSKNLTVKFNKNHSFLIVT